MVVKYITIQEELSPSDLSSKFPKSKVSSFQEKASSTYIRWGKGNDGYSALCKSVDFSRRIFFSPLAFVLANFFVLFRFPFFGQNLSGFHKNDTLFHILE